LYLGDNNSIIRMGYFIRYHIEKYARVPGWKTGSNHINR
jgi:hypothetical protein